MTDQIKDDNVVDATIVDDEQAQETVVAVEKTNLWRKVWRGVTSPFRALWACIRQPKQALYNIRKGIYHTVDFLKLWYKATIKQLGATFGVAAVFIVWIMFICFMLNPALTSLVLLAATAMSVVISIPSWVYFYKNVYKGHINLFRHDDDGLCYKMEEDRQNKLHRMQMEADESIQEQIETKQDALDVATKTEELKSGLDMLNAQIKKATEGAANLFDAPPAQPQIEGSPA